MYMYTWKQYIDVYTNKSVYVTVCVYVCDRERVGCVSVYVESVCECECVCMWRVCV